MTWTIQQMRDRLISEYPASTSWAAKVKRMSDSQIFAIFSKFQLQGRIK